MVGNSGSAKQRSHPIASFHTPEGGFRCSAPLNELHPVPEEGVSGTEFPFRTPEACFEHGGLLKMRRVPQEAVLRTECQFRTVEGPFWYRMLQKPERGRALLTPNSSNCQKRGGHCAKRSPECRRKQENHRPKVSQHLPKLLNTTQKLSNATQKSPTPPKTHSPPPKIHITCHDSTFEEFIFSGRKFFFPDIMCIFASCI